VVLPAIYLGALIGRETSAAYQRVQDMATTGELERLVGEAADSRPGLLFARITAPFQDKVQLDPATLLVTAAHSPSQEIVGPTTSLARNALPTVLDFLLMLVALFFFFRDGERITFVLRDLLPMEAAHKRVVFARLYDTLTAVVQSMALTAVAQGTLAGLGY